MPLKYAYYALVIGLVLIVAIFVVAAFKASDVIALAGTVTGTIGTVITAFFGIHVADASAERSESARRDAEAKRAKAEDKLQKVGAATDIDEVRSALGGP
jgi:class 3 adenylate cyclase